LATTATKYPELYAANSLITKRVDQLANLAITVNAVQIDVNAEFN
jgi:hypothetical protein